MRNFANVSACLDCLQTQSEQFLHHSFPPFARSHGNQKGGSRFCGSQCRGCSIPNLHPCCCCQASHIVCNAAVIWLSPNPTAAQPCAMGVPRRFCIIQNQTLCHVYRRVHTSSAQGVCKATAIPDAQTTASCIPASTLGLR